MEQLSAKEEGSQIFKIKKKKPPHFFYNKELKVKLFSKLNSGYSIVVKCYSELTPDGNMVT